MDRFMLFKKDQQLGRKRMPVQSQSAWTCKICKTQSAKYTCPRCNLPYCSLDCYRSEKHGECSESFYKDCVMDDLKSRNVDAETKKKMTNTLKKMFDESADEPDILGEDSEDSDSVDLEARLRGIDLDADEEQIWNCLTEEEKREFEQFVSSGNLGDVIQPWEPWWMTQILHPKIVEVGAPDVPTDRTDIPTILRAPDLTALFQRHPPADAVAFSCLNLLYAYILVARVYNGEHASENAEASAENLLEISRGLRGDGILTSPEEAVIGATIEADASSLRSLVESRELKAAAMTDLVRIVKDVVFVQAALSDVIALLKRAWKIAPGKRKLSLAFKKVEYFLAFLEGREDVLRRLIPNILRQQDEFVRTTLEQDAVQSITEQRPADRRPKIEEL
ncbi:putative Zinc finger HIT domain-containing protein 2 [Hypsibius exemplaris]|uniref:Zinc finger HIT domain-containing protein 2 n=1 Tax=Hypsibius exemplaris TaxID=2072580 RepID=A0A9X6NAD7_HYPEX|nr:putative Zinc finger HIT domain-containing protein 2 [Hypsibius exemplaris]